MIWRKYAYREALAGEAWRPLGRDGAEFQIYPDWPQGRGYGQGAWRQGPGAPRAHPSMALRRCPADALLPRAGTWAILRSFFVSDSPPRTTHTGHGAELAIEMPEDSVCLEELDKLDSVDEPYEYWHNSDLTSLANHIKALNKSRPRVHHLDTVLINNGVGNVLFKNYHGSSGQSYGYYFPGGNRLHLNVTVIGRLVFLHHPNIPPGCAYALSSTWAPMIIYGSLAPVRTSDGMVEVRHCQLVEPPRDMSGCPWGVRFDVKNNP